MFALSALALGRAESEAQTQKSSTKVQSQQALIDYAGSGKKWGYNLLILLNDRVVQRELAITQRQRASLAKLGNEFLDAFGPLVRKRRQEQGGTATQEEARLAEFARERASLVEHFGKKTVKLLSDQQRERLGQVVFQLRGVEILDYPDVANTLQLTDEQKAQIAENRVWIIREARKLHKLFMEERQDRKRFEEGLDEVFEQAKQQAIGTLNAQQRQLLEALHGPSIGFSRRDLRLEIRREINATNDHIAVEEEENGSKARQ